MMALNALLHIVFYLKDLIKIKKLKATENDSFLFDLLMCIYIYICILYIGVCVSVCGKGKKTTFGDGFKWHSKDGRPSVTCVTRMSRILPEGPYEINKLGSFLADG